MPQNKQDASHGREPAGFTPRSGGPASERAREQGWQTNEDERTSTPRARQPMDGGTDYDYGARDFGDLPEDTSAARAGAPAKRTAAHEKAPEKKRRKHAA